jgi:hypothetical protein
MTAVTAATNISCPTSTVALKKIRPAMRSPAATPGSPRALANEAVQQTEAGSDGHVAQLPSARDQRFARQERNRHRNRGLDRRHWNGDDIQK